MKNKPMLLLLLVSISLSSLAMQDIEIYPFKLIEETHKTLTRKQLSFYEAIMQCKLSADVNEETIHFNDSKSDMLYICSLTEAHRLLEGKANLFEQFAVISLCTSDQVLSKQLSKYVHFFENTDLKELDCGVVETLKRNRSELQQAIIAEDLTKIKTALAKPIQPEQLINKQ